MHRLRHVFYPHNPGASKKNRRTLKRLFYDYLSRYPEWQIVAKERVNLLIEGTYFSNRVCVVLYREHNVKATLFYRLTDGEWEEELHEDLGNIMRLGVNIERVTCEGLNNILKAVKQASPNTIIQRCLAHIQRECLTWLTRRPQSEAGASLRLIMKRLYTIYNREKWGYWVVDLVRWYERHKDFVNQKTFKHETGRYWFTHKSVRKVFIQFRPSETKHIASSRIIKGALQKLYQVVFVL